MANELDETRPVINEQGRRVNVMEQTLPVTIGVGSVIFEIALWVLGILPGIIFIFMKIKARNYFQQLQQKLQHDASQIDNFLEQRVLILQNAAALVNKAISLDKDVMTAIAALRSGQNLTDATRPEVSSKVDNLFTRLNLSVENYPDIKAHASIADAMQQNSYLQKEITAAREVYNDSVFMWNKDIFNWPTKQIVAARAGYTTRIPFTASKEVKEDARGQFF